MTNNPRRQLPPQIKKLSITDRRTGKSVVRYEVTVDTGASPETGRRRQARRRYSTEKEARAALAEIADATAKGQFVARSTVTVEQVCADYTAGRHKLRRSSLAKLAYDLEPLREQHGSMPVQRLAKAHLDRLVADLLSGGTLTAKGRIRRPWSAVAVNKVIATIDQVLADAQQQGLVARNVAQNMNRVAKARQSAERLALGAGAFEYVVSNEAGEPYSPAVLSRYWRDAVKAAGVRHIKLHAARHTCATLMHLQGVPVAVIAAWIGHKDASLTMRLYAHSQTEALKAAGASLDRVVTTS